MGTGTSGPGTAPGDFLSKWEQRTECEVHVHQPTAGPYQKVKLYDFTFLGRRFRGSNYVGRRGSATGPIVEGTQHSGAGVCAEMADALRAAQRDIFKAYAAEVASRKPPEEPNEASFTNWCGVGDLLGWQFRGGQHARGSAIDIDAGRNPYIATRTGVTFGGEKYPGGLGHEHPKLISEDELEGIPEPRALKGVRPLAVDAYHHAWSLRYLPTQPLDISCFRGGNAGETLAQAYDRFAALHGALVAYFDLAYLRFGSVNMPAESSGMLREYGEGTSPSPSSYLGRVAAYSGIYFPNMPTSSSQLAALHEQIQADYRAVRLVMVTGSLVDTKGSGFNGSGLVLNASRDPCRGFLSIRKEIVVCLRNHLARWGAMDFGAQASGDIMHFDRGHNASVSTTPDPNPDNVFYV